jgi:hypothetical protein
MRTKMIHTSCHCCKKTMVFESVPVTITDLDGERKTYHGRDDAIWICKVCREYPTRLKAARVAAGMPAVPVMPSEFELEQF